MTEVKQPQIWDVIIIGGGPAGYRQGFIRRVI